MIKVFVVFAVVVALEAISITRGCIDLHQAPAERAAMTEHAKSMEISNNTPYSYVVLEGHEYISRRGYDGGITHSPDCVCVRNTNRGN